MEKVCHYRIFIAVFGFAHSADGSNETDLCNRPTSLIASGRLLL